MVGYLVLQQRNIYDDIPPQMNSLNIVTCISMLLHFCPISPFKSLSILKLESCKPH